MPDDEEIPRGERGVPCSYADRPIKCQHRFPDKQSMIAHKISDPTHFYCKRCREDCDDWQSLVDHKVDKMAPFIEGRKKIRDEKPLHIVCEFCGEDYKSFDGRKRHRAMMHPADQDVDCPGCHKKFIRATHMIDHIERDECRQADGTRGIERWMLHSSINHKYIMKDVMQDPGGFNDSVIPIKGHGNEAVDLTEGGVALKDLLEDEDGAQMGGYKALEPEHDLIDFWPKPKIAAPIEWPTVGVESQEPVLDITEDVKEMSVRDTGSSRRGILKKPKSGQGSASQASGAWSGTKASNALFPSAKATPPAGEWSAVYQNQVDKIPNMMDTQFWNPHHEDYQVDFGFNSVVQAYICPFQSCDGESFFPDRNGLDQHIYETHWIKMFRCPACFRRYDSVAALMGHVENTSKCGVKGSKNFEAFISEITGGFLTAQSVSQPKIFKANKAMIKVGDEQEVAGVMKMRFQGTLPAVATRAAIKPTDEKDEAD